ncbi:hypothetical protein PACTADRAFT_40113 [Pachysolen tannophilus NRRL Y-2460]|uniref:AMMECR1 domain-containing protein n=1 Tax=Pachysolen tannophilus NRRL Y-2460 TaxID=669874 RepID=A0A1E4TZX4_PACTA|nr:hypothetical protein PACTADRAFT_40113 [Pachysolen tannophilus NRRL Y-2460]
MTLLRKSSSGSPSSFKSYSLSTYKKYCKFPVEEDDPPSPLFVTWNVLVDPSNNLDEDSDNRLLRGCIGCFSDLEVEEGIREYATIAAFQDSRFKPIGLSELNQLECSVTLLKNFQQCQDPIDWELGKNGIKISFMFHSKKMGATFLPEVAIEQNWDKEQTLKNLIRKAGCPAGTKLLDLKNLQVIKYEGYKTKITYHEYKKLKDQMDKEIKNDLVFE